MLNHTQVKSLLSGHGCLADWKEFVDTYGVSAFYPKQKVLAFLGY